MSINLKSRDLLKFLSPNNSTLRAAPCCQEVQNGNQHGDKNLMSSKNFDSGLSINFVQLKNISHRNMSTINRFHLRHQFWGCSSIEMNKKHDHLIYFRCYFCITYLKWKEGFHYSILIFLLFSMWENRNISRPRLV